MKCSSCELPVTRTTLKAEGRPLYDCPSCGYRQYDEVQP